MVKINQRYLNEANRIRENYIKIIDEINKKEKEIFYCKKRIEILMEEGEKCVKNNKEKKVETVREELKEQLSEIDENINKIVNKLNPLFDKLNKLKKEAHDLYISIKDNYPELSEAEIQKQVLMSLKR